MNDPTGAQLWVDNIGTYKYAIVTGDGKIWNFLTGVWEAMPATPSSDHLRAMVKKVLGQANWSQDIVPAVTPYASQLTAIVFTVDASGKPTGFRESADLTSTQATLTLYATSR